MQSPSRRAFLTGRRSPRSPWESFLTQLRRVAEGSVYDFSTPSGSARLVARSLHDVHHARALCLEHGVCLALDGVPHAAALDASPVLWVEPGPEMERHERLGAGDSRWFVQPGCLIGALEQAGLPQFRYQPPHLTVAAWLADRSLSDWDCGATADSGLVHALVLLADGTQANLGAFGAENHKPLSGLRLQQLVPRLFELSTSAEAASLCEGKFWEGRYRLDALRPTPGRTVNLAHLLLGHGGELGWVEWLVFDEQVGRPGQRDYVDRYGQRSGPRQADPQTDAAIKALFDPTGLFPARGQNFD